MSLTYQLERWAQFWQDCQPLITIHWKELALDQEWIPLGVNEERFASVDALDMLHILTVRDEGRLVGYFLAIVMPHMHYKDAGPMAFTDMYFIHPDYRIGGTGAKMLAEVERTLRARGVVKAYLSTKVHQDHSDLFEKMGWRFTDKAFTKSFREG